MLKISRYSFAAWIPIILFLCQSCGKEIEIRQGRQVSEILEEAEKLTSQSRYDEAVGLAFEALRISENGEEDRINQSKSHLTLSKLFLQTSRDSLSWEHADAAEELAIRERNDSLRAAALLLKGKICSYATISAESNRDDEGIGYLEEALNLSEANRWDGISIEACYFLCEIYVNKNRFNDIIDRDLYNKAGEWLLTRGISQPGHFLPACGICVKGIRLTRR